MRDFWLRHYTDSALAHSESPLKQVGKTVNGIEVEEEQITLIVEHITKALALITTDTLIDLCCGNGILTVHLAERVSSVIGIDFTESLLVMARKRYSRSNINYRLENILELSPQFLASVNRLTMYEALQHLTVAQFIQLMNNLKQQPTGTRIFIGGIPDQSRLHNFYNTDEKFRFYQEREQAGYPHIGRWWLEEEIHELAVEAGYSMTTLAQPTRLYSAYYRFDVLLEKQE